MARRSLIVLIALLAGGCAYLPEISRQPQIHNPFPQLSRVAIVPFVNLSNEPTVDGTQVALAYANELQSIPGFEVLPVGVTSQYMRAYGLSIDNAAEARKLAQIMEVDAVVVGAVTDFTPYYPPRCGLQTEWYSANPGFHPIPPGYGLPWGTPDEEQIPPQLIFAARMSLAREQMKTQEPAFAAAKGSPPSAPPRPLPAPEQTVGPSSTGVRTVAHQEAIPPGAPTPPTGTPGGVPGAEAAGVLPPDWPDPNGFTPPGPNPSRPPLVESTAPVLQHSRVYNGHDADVTTALESYVYFRDDARFGGWQAYLQRSDDFVRFCCHLHLAEMLTARGGAGETRVVWRWPTGR